MPRSSQVLLVLTLGLLAGCGNGTVIGSGPGPTSPPVTPNVSYEYTVPTASSAPASIVTGVNGYLYFTESAASKIGQLTTGGAFTEIATKTASAGPLSIAAGPDGNLWWTERSIHAIATVTSAFTAAAQTEYTVPWAGSSPNILTRGVPPGSLYFTDPGANAIGRIQTDGTITGPFTIPTAAAGPIGIAIGPDNNMWFTEHDVNKIGILNPATNAISEIALPAGAHPEIIVGNAPDGAIWFTENYAGAPKLGRITTSHAFTEYALTGALSAVGLAVDLFGDLIVADQSGSAIGLFTLSTQKYTSYPTKTPGAQPLWLTVGPDGRMYFTEYAANKIGQFTYF